MKSQLDRLDPASEAFGEDAALHTLRWAGLIRYPDEVMAPPSMDALRAARERGWLVYGDHGWTELSDLGRDELERRLADAAAGWERIGRG